MYNIVEFETLNSTNKFALEHIKEYEPNTIIRAQIQKNGRGRFARKWISDKKNNCYISFILKPDLKHKENFKNLTQYLSIVLCKTLSEYGICTSIKWPNDVQISGKKIAGILSEISFSGKNFNGIILGIGVNLNLEQKDLENINIPATSLNIELSQKIDSKIFIDKLVQKFFENYEILLEKGFAPFRAEYIALCNFLGKEITIKNPKIEIQGKAINIKEDGTLEIIIADGSIKTILSGDVLF